MGYRNTEMKFIRDPDSSTGYSAAILIRNFRPRKIGDQWLFVDRKFRSRIPINCEDYMGYPKVELKIYCNTPKKTAEKIKRRKAYERAALRSPMLK